MMRQRGMTLVEMALALVVLGLLGVLVAQVLGYTSRQQQAVFERDLLVRADDAITSFVLAHDRLPCVDEDGDGREDCAATSAQSGRLPYLDIGLPDARAARLRYGVLRRPAASGLQDADFAVARQRFVPLATTDTMRRPVSDYNALDICHAARIAAGQGFDPAFLHTGDGAGARHVAYALAAPGVLDADGDGNLLDGSHSNGGVRFETPQRSSAPDYDDHVVAVGFDQLWGRLGCGEALAAAGHAHYNAAISIVLLRQGAYDYVKVLKLGVELADAGVTGAQAAVLSTTAGAAGATADVLIATSETLLTMGAMAPVLALGLAAVAANVAAAISAGLALEEAEKALRIAKEQVVKGEIVAADANVLAPQIETNAKAAIAAGLY